MNNRIAEVRKSRGVKQTELARALGIRTTRLGTWERGEREPTFLDACRIADVLHCTLDELAGRPEPAIRYKDPDQLALNGYWESMNKRGRDAVLEAVRLISSSADVRVEKDGQNLRVSPAMGA